MAIKLSDFHRAWLLIKILSPWPKLSIEVVNLIRRLTSSYSLSTVCNSVSQTHRKKHLFVMYRFSVSLTLTLTGLRRRWTCRRGWFCSTSWAWGRRRTTQSSSPSRRNNDTTPPVSATCRVNYSDASCLILFVVSLLIRLLFSLLVVSSKFLQCFYLRNNERTFC